MILSCLNVSRWAETELQQAHAQLELGLASRTSTWKASLWARKLEQLKGRNDALADGLNSALKRLAKQEDRLEEAQLKMETIQVRAPRWCLGKLVVASGHRKVATCCRALQN
jgi:hypothetical protein